MWTWLRILIPEPTPAKHSPLRMSDADGLNARQVAENQRLSVLRRGGLMNLTAKPGFAVLWVGLAFLIYSHVTADWLLLPAFLSLWWSLGLFKRYRLIKDTPTTRLSSSAQGYVELCGTAKLPDQEGHRGLPHLPVTVWLPGYIEAEPFILDDGYGCCLLYPAAAEIVTRPAANHLPWLHAIYPGQTLYVLGEIRTHGGDNRSLERQAQLSELLAKWKRNPLFLENFDTDDNGKIDLDEWETARSAAEQQVDELIRIQKNAPGTHIMDGSQGGQLFLITNIPPDELAGRYYWAALFHLLAWLGLMGVAHVFG